MASAAGARPSLRVRRAVTPTEQPVGLALDGLVEAPRRLGLLRRRSSRPRRSNSAKPSSSRRTRRSSSQKQRLVTRSRKARSWLTIRTAAAAAAEQRLPGSRWRRCRGGWSARPAAARRAPRRRPGPGPRGGPRRRTGPRRPGRVEAEGLQRRLGLVQRRAAGGGVVEQGLAGDLRLLRHAATTRVPGEQDALAAVRLDQAGQDAQQGRLAGAVAADQAGAAPGLQRQVDAVEQPAEPSASRTSRRARTGAISFGVHSCGRGRADYPWEGLRV